MILRAKGISYFLLLAIRIFCDKSFAASADIEILEDPYTITFNEMKIIISHGDFLCTHDSEYMDFRKQVRSQAWKDDFLSKPLEERKQIADDEGCQ